MFVGKLFSLGRPLVSYSAPTLTAVNAKSEPKHGFVGTHQGSLVGGTGTCVSGTGGNAQVEECPRAGGAMIEIEGADFGASGA